MPKIERSAVYCISKICRKQKRFIPITHFKHRFHLLELQLETDPRNQLPVHFAGSQSLVSNERPIWPGCLCQDGGGRSVCKRSTFVCSLVNIILVSRHEWLWRRRLEWVRLTDILEIVLIIQYVNYANHAEIMDLFANHCHSLQISLFKFWDLIFSLGISLFKIYCLKR